MRHGNEGIYGRYGWGGLALGICSFGAVILNVVAEYTLPALVFYLGPDWVHGGGFWSRAAVGCCLQAVFLCVAMLVFWGISFGGAGSVTPRPGVIIRGIFIVGGLIIPIAWEIVLFLVGGCIVESTFAVVAVFVCAKLLLGGAAFLLALVLKLACAAFRACL